MADRVWTVFYVLLEPLYISWCVSVCGLQLTPGASSSGLHSGASAGKRFLFSDISLKSQNLLGLTFRGHVVLSESIVQTFSVAESHWLS